MSNNEAWVDMTDAEKWSYVRRLEDAVADMIKELGTRRQSHRAFIEDTAERIFASGILDEIAESDGGDGRDAMDDALAIARIAIGIEVSK